MAGFDIEQVFTYHAPRGDQAERYVALRAKAKELAYLIEGSVPDSRERAMALTWVQLAVMCANAGIAIHEAEPET
jgi:hypothetical protein